MFRREQTLVPLYDAISRQAVLAADALRVAGIPGKKITPVLALEVGSRLSIRIEGRGIEHTMGPARMRVDDEFSRAVAHLAGGHVASARTAVSARIDRAGHENLSLPPFLTRLRAHRRSVLARALQRRCKHRRCVQKTSDPSKLVRLGTDAAGTRRSIRCELPAGPSGAAGRGPKMAPCRRVPST